LALDLSMLMAITRYRPATPRFDLLVPLKRGRSTSDKGDYGFH
jgi:hypothetical protein